MHLTCIYISYEVMSKQKSWPHGTCSRPFVWVRIYIYMCVCVCMCAYVCVRACACVCVRRIVVGCDVTRRMHMCVRPNKFICNTYV